MWSLEFEICASILCWNLRRKMRVGVCVCVCLRERNTKCVCERERERGREERERECVCVQEWEREREMVSESERECANVLRAYWRTRQRLPNNKHKKHKTIKPTPKTKDQNRALWRVCSRKVICVVGHCGSQAPIHIRIWRRNCVCWLVSPMIWMDKTFVNWRFLHHGFEQIASMWLLSIWVRIVFISSFIVCEARNCNWNSQGPNRSLQIEHYVWPGLMRSKQFISMSNGFSDTFFVRLDAAWWNFYTTGIRVG